MDIIQASQILAQAAEYPRCFSGWPKDAAEEAAEKVIRGSSEKAAIAAEDVEFCPELASRREEESARMEEARRALVSVLRGLQKRGVTVTANVAYLGGGRYGIRVGRNVRPSKEVILPGMTAADKGREVTVEVSGFDAKII